MTVSEADSLVTESPEHAGVTGPEAALPETVTRKLSVVGIDGKPRITLSVDDKGDPHFVMTDSTGWKQLRARIDDQGIWLQMMSGSESQAAETRSVDLVALNSGHLGIEFTVDGLAAWGVYAAPDGSVRIGAPEG